MRLLVVTAAGFTLLASDALPAQQQAEAGHRHSLTLFVGAAVNAERHETAVAVGPSYRYQLTRRLAAGPILELISYESETSTFALAGVFLKLYRGIELTMAPGVEWITGTAAARESIVEHGEFTSRFALGYQMQLRRGYSIAPEAALNVGSGVTTARYGLTFGISF